MRDDSADESLLPARTVNTESVREFLTFAVGGEEFGVALTEIVEILGIRTVTPVPRAPSDVVGVCTLRGELVTVLDTRQRLRVAAATAPRRGRILLASAAEGEKVGLMVDEVLGVRRFSESQIEATASALVGDISPHIESVGRDGSRVTVLVNLRSLTS